MKYSARIYLGEDEIFHQSGDDLDELYTRMLAHAEDMFGDVHGDIIDNITKQIVRQFRKAPPD